MNPIFLQALARKNSAPRPPIWLMRQAGRYMASYQKVRAKYNFLEMCKNPELVFEVTKLPIDEFGFDAAIVFSDILLISEAMGLPLAFEEKRGPVIATPLRTQEDLKRLFSRPVVENLRFVIQAIKLLKKELKVPLIGFAGAPFTVASYMIEGCMADKKAHLLSKTKSWLYSDPKSFHSLLQVIEEYTVDFLNAQIDAGVDAIQLFDSWANVLPSDQFEECSASYTKRIFSRLKKCPRIIFCKGSSIFYESLQHVGAECIGLDLNRDLPSVRKKLGQDFALQGNLDPEVLLAREDVMLSFASKLLTSMKGDPGFIFNLGHGILPTTPEKNVKALVDLVQSFS